MTSLHSSHNRRRVERLTSLFGAFRPVFLTIFLLGFGVSAAIVVLQARQHAAHEESIARMLIDSEGMGAAELSGIVQQTDLTHIRLVDGQGTVLSSNDVREIGELLDKELLAQLKSVESGYFSRVLDVRGRKSDYSGLKDDPAERMIVMSKSARSPFAGALPVVLAGLILSLALCTLVALRAWSWSSGNHEAALELESALRLVSEETNVSANIERIERALAGGPFENVAGLITGLITRVRSSRISAAAATEMLATVFDAIPHPAYIRTGNGRIAAVNRTLCDELDRSAADLRDEPESELRRVLPTDRIRMLLDRKGFRNRGITGLIVSPSSNRLTIVPVTYEGAEAHLVMLDLNEQTVHNVERDGPETPRGLRMAIELAESEGRLRPQQGTENFIASNEISSGLADLYGATDLAVWAIDESGRTLHWSRAARRFTGVWKREIPDVEAFCRTILTDDEQRQTLLRWLESDPTRLSRQLVCRVDDDTPIGLTWNADETLVRTRPGEMKRVTVLWCKMPVPAPF